MIFIYFKQALYKDTNIWTFILYIMIAHMTLQFTYQRIIEWLRLEGTLQIS